MVGNNEIVGLMMVRTTGQIRSAGRARASTTGVHDLKTEQEVVARGWRKGEMGSDCLMETQCEMMMRKFWSWRVVMVTQTMYLMPPSCTLKNSSDGTSVLCLSVYNKKKLSRERKVPTRAVRGGTVGMLLSQGGQSEETVQSPEARSDRGQRG